MYFNDPTAGRSLLSSLPKQPQYTRTPAVYARTMKCEECSDSIQLTTLEAEDVPLLMKAAKEWREEHDH